jgi:hypothetical protein
MTSLNEALTQEDVVQGARQSGDTQAGGADAQDDSSGKEGVGAKEQRTYTETEFAEAVGTRDRRNAQSRQALAQMALEADVARAETAEERAIGVDSKRVSDGELTQGEAESRSRDRIHQAAEEIKVGQNRNMERARESAARETLNHQMRAGDDLGVLFKTAEASKKHGVDLLDLTDRVTKDRPSHPTEIDMIAREMKLEAKEAARPGEKKYDSGRSSGSGASMNDLSPGDKIRRGISDMTG